MTRAQLERHQLWAYLAAVVAGLGLGAVAPALAAGLEGAVWPVLALLLYATFTQMPLTRLAAAARDGRFLVSLLLGNFVAVPVLVALLLPLLPPDPALRLGVLLVLLVPCTDWFITFTHLGKGDAARATAATPLLLLAQFALLPLWLWLFLGEALPGGLAPGHAVTVFATLIALPLLAAWLTEAWAARRPMGGRARAGLAWVPVPLLALVLFLVAASQLDAARAALPGLGAVVLVFGLYLLAAPVLGLALGRAFGLGAPASRTLVFSLGTRNSFVVLPLALALPAGWEAAAVVVVLQSLVELLGLLAYLRLVPRLIPGPSP